MGRQHIHLSEDFPGSKQVISGMRSNCQVVVYIDVKKCLQGIETANFILLNKIK